MSRHIARERRRRRYWCLLTCLFLSSNSKAFRPNPLRPRRPTLLVVLDNNKHNNDKNGRRAADAQHNPHHDENSKHPPNHPTVAVVFSQQQQPKIHGASATSSTSSTVSPSPEEEELLELSEVNVVYQARSRLVYDAVNERYKSNRMPSSSSSSSKRQRGLRRLLTWLNVAFVPAAVTGNYYRFMTWRLWHRFINANLNVFGTQCLVLSLGVGGLTKATSLSHAQLGALSAALQWVMKDALGKLVRMAWASKMGSHMDGDAKRWMMRSAFSFGLGNFLEIATYMLPHLFLVLAALSNCCKQVSMLTGSSTKSAIFNTFRDGSMAENIGDISAKGEAQVAIVDLVGLATGVILSKAVVGTSIHAILVIYAILQSFELACVYRQIRSVEFRVLNFERMMTIITAFCDGVQIPTPPEMARSERMMRPPDRLCRRQVAFGSLSRCKLSPDELKRLLDIFQNERFLLLEWVPM
jgi:Vitamin B6 photo-protection and homoeostasis